MEEMPSLNPLVQRLKVTTLPLDLPCSGPVTHSGEILTTGKSHGKKPDRFSLNDLQNKYTNYKGIKNNISFRQITGIQEKLDTTCK
jgi:hypothetical protein